MVSKHPVWLLTIIYSAIVIALNAFGLKNFGKIETFMSFIKVSALVLFIIIGIAAMLGVFTATHPIGVKTLLDNGGFFPKGFKGFLQSMLIVIFPMPELVWLRWHPQRLKIRDKIYQKPCFDF